MRERVAQTRADEIHDQHLERERRRIARRRQVCRVNSLSIYKAATDADTSCHSLQFLNMACIHSGVFHFPEIVKIQINKNYFKELM